MNVGKIENLHGLIDAVYQAQEKFAKHECWWRGHGQETWELVARVHRAKPPERYEKNIALRFRAGALPRHSQCPATDNFPGWLSLMQHYGLPTRLLDWSKSALIAAFFIANYPKRDNEPGALWVLQPELLNEAEGWAKLIRVPPETDELYQAPFGDVKEVDRIYADQIPEQDLRMLVQLGVHTVHGSNRAIEAHKDQDKFLMKWVVPAVAKSRIRGELGLLGIRTSTVFPDLEHLARDITELRFPVGECSD